MDGSTDSSTTEQETIFIRYCKDGQIVIRFLCIGEPRSTSAADLFDFVMLKISENNMKEHMYKFIGFGCDEASNMLGIKNGLVALLKNEHSELVGVHCLAHRMELAYKDVVKSDKLYVQVTTLLLGLYYFYKNSSKQKRNLKEAIKVCLKCIIIMYLLLGS